MLLGKSNAAALVSEVQRYLKDAASELNSPFGRVDHPSLTEHHQAHRRKNPLPAINSMSRDETPEKDSARNSTTDDVEAQPILKLSTSVDNTARLATEYRTSMSTKLIHLASYFLLNLSLTLYNKALLNNVSLCYLLVTYYMWCRILIETHSSSFHGFSQVYIPALRHSAASYFSDEATSR
jgi:hypothetical protein